jgi:hypothetical protein
MCSCLKCQAWATADSSVASSPQGLPRPDAQQRQVVQPGQQAQRQGRGDRSCVTGQRRDLVVRGLVLRQPAAGCLQHAARKRRRLGAPLRLLRKSRKQRAVGHG